MDSNQTKAYQATLGIRPGLLLVFIVLVVLALYEKTSLVATFAAAPVTAKRVCLLIATFGMALGWLLLRRDSPDLSWRRWIVLGGATVLTFLIPAYVLYTIVPIKLLIRFPLLFEITSVLFHWGDLIALVAWVGPFFGRGRSRIAFVAAGTLMLILWNAHL